MRPRSLEKSVLSKNHRFIEGLAFLKQCLSMLRIHQWSKNLLIFLPAIFAQKSFSLDSFLHTLLGFFALSCLASATYILNDLRDLKEDKIHPVKKLRVLADGKVSKRAAGFWISFLLVVHLLTLLPLSAPFRLFCFAYASISILYSFFLRKIFLIDAMTLAVFFTLRLHAGGALAEVPISKWLNIFSLFTFFSLALLKRYIELTQHRLEQSSTRGYRLDDSNAVLSLGVSSGSIACLILALYVASTEAASAYPSPAFLWLSVPLVQYWLARIWFLAHRRMVPDDPILFAVKDKASYAVIFFAAVVLCLAKSG